MVLHTRGISYSILTQGSAPYDQHQFCMMVPLSSGQNTLNIFVDSFANFQPYGLCTQQSIITEHVVCLRSGLAYTSSITNGQSNYID